MTEYLPAPEQPEDPDAFAPPDPRMQALAREATDVPSHAIPREMMWARVQQQRSQQRAPQRHTPSGSGRAPAGTSPWLLRAVGIAAVLVGGIGVGRYLLPATGPSKYQLAITQSASRADSIKSLGLGPDAIAALPRSNDPAYVAMEEHLVRTVSLLTEVRDDDPTRIPSANVNGSARELLSTTRLLLDEPQLRDERTRRLLQDLELVLVQIIQARGAAPETKRAASETIRETNLLPRVRAAVTATRRGDELNSGGED